MSSLLPLGKSKKIRCWTSKKELWLYQADAIRLVH